MTIKKDPQRADLNAKRSPTRSFAGGETYEKQLISS